jgi:hypothetical protein
MWFGHIIKSFYLKYQLLLSVDPFIVLTKTTHLATHTRGEEAVGNDK